MNNIKPTTNNDTVKYDKHLDVDSQNPVIRLSVMGSKIALANFSVKEKAIILRIGANIVKINAITEVTPTAFFIKTLLTTTRSNPSFIKPPTNGTEFEIAYFTAFIDIPS